MAYSDPQSVSVGAETVSLPRTGSSPTSGAFTASDRSLSLTVSHQHGKRIRRNARLDSRKIVANALVPSQNTAVSASAYVVLDQPVNGYSAQELIDQLVALADWLKADTNAAKLVGSEI